MECLASRRTDEQTQVLQQSTHLVLQIQFDLDQQRAILQERTQCMAVEPLDTNLLERTALHDQRDAKSIIAIALVDLSELPSHARQSRWADADVYHGRWGRRDAVYD